MPPRTRHARTKNASIPLPVPESRKRREPEEVIDSSDTSGDNAPILQRKGKGIAGSSRSQPPRDPRDYLQRLRWSPSEISAKLDQVTFLATRYPDRSLLRDMGILDDVDAMFATMGLAKFMEGSCDTYVDMVKEFFSTLLVHLDAPEVGRSEEVDIRCRLTFMIGDKKYTVTSTEISRIYGLQRGTVGAVQEYPEEPHLVWNEIGSGEYKKGLAKSARIRHPAVRYVHKALANTFYARKETGSILAAEMSWLLVGLRPFLRHLNNGEGIRTTSDKVSFVAMFVQMLKSHQEWIMTHTDTKPTLIMGGLLTPLFLTQGIPLRGKRLSQTLVDYHYLRKADFLAGRQRLLYAYTFYSTVQRKRIILLPQVHLTYLRNPNNPAFHVPPEYIYDRHLHGPLDRALRTPAPGHAVPEPAPDPPSPPRESNPNYGSSRYYFRPYDGPANLQSLGAAHEHIHILQRYIDWQHRSLKKMASHIKGLKRDMRILKNKVSGASCSGTAQDVVMGTDDRPERSRRRERRARPPTPDFEHSDNESLSLGSDSD